MAKLTRVFSKLFGVSGASSTFGKFGSKTAGSPVTTQDPATIQELAAFDNGLASAVASGRSPYLEDLNGLFLLLFRQIGYLFQSGIAEWDKDTTYYIGSICQVSGVQYTSLVDDNINYSPTSEPTKWVTGQPYVKLSDRKTSGTGGGAFTQGAWRTRVLNTEDNDTGAICTLSSNQFTLPAGTYDIAAYGSADECGIHKMRIYDITHAAEVLTGLNCHALVSNVITTGHVSGRVTVAEATTFELQHQCQNTSTFGLAASFGDDEVYAVVEIRKIA